MAATLIIGVILVLFGIAVLVYPPLLALLAGIALILGGAVMVYRAFALRGRAV